jgi:D-sedoheptulose 7-phosphate isomerase
VIVGKRALPAIALPNDAATMTGFATAGHPEAAFAHALRQLARPGDIALGVASDAGDPALREALRAARDLGLLTVALLDTPQQDPPDVDHVLWARSGDPRVVKESHVTIYHILWELVHVLLDQPGVLDAEDVT